MAKAVAWNFVIKPVTSGRLEVLSINLSRSLSITILKAFALPAASVPATIVAKVNPKLGKPFSAKTMAGKVETNRSSTTLSFIRSM